MAIFDDEPTKNRCGSMTSAQDLSRLSAASSSERIGQLQAEIERLEAELSTKGATKAAAEALFPALDRSTMSL